MMKIKRTLVGILVMVLLVGTGFTPVINAHADVDLAAPTGVKVSNTAIDTELIVSWEKVTGADGYYVYMSTSEEDLYENARYYKSIKTTDTSYTASGLEKNKTYYFQIEPYISKGSYSCGDSEIVNCNISDAFTADKVVVSFDSDSNVSVQVLNIIGDEIDSSNYAVSKEEISTQKGCPTYKVTVIWNALYGNKVLTKAVTVSPKNIIPFGIRESYWPDGKVTYTVQFNYSKSVLEKLDGVQYVIGKDKDFKNIYVKATTKLKAPKHAFALDGMLDKTFSGEKGKNYFIKYRVYIVVDGKKIYSEWQYYTHRF